MSAPDDPAHPAHPAPARPPVWPAERLPRPPAVGERPPRGRWLVRLLFESVLIVLSVLVALTANGWREERAARVRIEEAREAFAEELRYNRGLLRQPEYQPYHQGMHDLYAALNGAEGAERDTLERRLREDFNTGIHPTPLRDAVWRSLSAGGVFERMDYDEIVLLAGIYREQETLDRMFWTMFGTWMQPRSDRDDPAYQRDDLQVTRMFLNDVISAERRLLTRYDEALAQLGGAAGDTR